MPNPIEILANADGNFDFSVLFIGGYGLRLHGYVRNTNDIDVLMARSDLDSLNAELQKVGYVKTAETPIAVRFESVDLVFAPIDVLLMDDDVFEKLSSTATNGLILESPVRAPSVLNFIALKLHAIRNDPERKHKDLADIRELIGRQHDKIDKTEYLNIVEKYAPPSITEEIREWIDL